MVYKIDYTIVECYQKKNLCYVNAEKCKKVGIVRHNTGAGNKYLKRYVVDVANLGANQYGNHWNQKQTGSDRKMVHYFIGLDKDDVLRIYHVLPDDYKCWGNGSHPTTKKSCNSTHIQYEICDDKFQDKDYFEATHKLARYLEAYLCKKYGWSANVIMSHKETYDKKCGSNHGDDDNWLKKFGTNMNNERKLVQELIDSNLKTSGSTPTPSQPSGEVTKPETNKPALRPKREVVEALQKAMNKDYGTGLSVDGVYGEKTKLAVKSHNIKKGSKVNCVKWIQTVCNELGFKDADGKKLVVDGAWRTRTTYAVKAMQKAFGLTQDAIVGTGTVSKILAKYK